MYKVCFVTTISLTLKSFVLEFAKFLHESGKVEIHFVCDYDSDFEKMLPSYIHYKPIRMKRGISLDGIKATYEMYRYFRKERFDLVQYSTPNASCYASIAAKFAKIPCRLYCQWGIAYVGFKGIKRRVFKLVEKIVCNWSTRVEPDSFGNLQFGRKEGLYGESKSYVVWNGSASGVSLEKFNISKKQRWRTEIRQKYSIPEDSVVYIFIGRVTRDKGVNELFSAAKSLIEQKEDVYLLLVGSVEKTESVDENLYQWSSEDSRVIYSGYTNEVEKHLAASDIYILPSYREGFGSAIIEAEAMGIPVIVTNIPGPTDAMQKDVTGLVVEKGNVDELYSAMEKLYCSKELRLQMGAEAVEFALSKFEQKALFEKITADRLKLIEEG